MSEPFKSPLSEPACWPARLRLSYERRAGRSVLAAKEHEGPLVVQKPLYPEGEAICHSIILHPPAGIVGGDQLTLQVLVGDQAHALLTTPGATKWYRSAGAAATQTMHFSIGNEGCLEWLPQESIVFDGAQAHNETQINLAAKALFLGWDIICLGRTGSAQSFQTGRWGSKLSIHREGKALWIERAAIEAGDLLMRSKAGLSGCSVYATFVATVQTVQASLIQECRTVVVEKGVASVSQLPGLLVGRYLGDSSQAAKNYFIALWQKVRPVVVGCEAQRPRIWNT